MGSPTAGTGSFVFACPRCRTRLWPVSEEEQRCPEEEMSYRRIEGIWRFVTPDRLARFSRFIEEYETVRQAEGRGTGDPAYYRALPFQDLTGRHAGNWRIRSRSFEVFRDRLLLALEAEREEPLRAVDLGAGNGWLSYRLAQRGHGVAAVDLLTNRSDGLGSHLYYDAAFTPLQAEFDRLPFEGGQLDLAVFNASLHYATSYEDTLSEALRVLRHQGLLVILDSPVYRKGSSGEQMVREREAQFRRDYGFASNSLPNENYLTFDRLDQLAGKLGIRWEILEPFYGWRWALRPWRARLRGRREPAKFMLIVGRRA